MFKYRIKISLIILLLFSSVLAVGESSDNYYFTTISGESGLSQNNVKCILQDSWGFMWFGTRNRLNRYDGKSIKVFDCKDVIADVENNNITALYEDADKKLWVGTDEGIYIYNPFKESFSFFNEATAEGKTISGWIADIQSDTFNNIWIVVPRQGLFRYNFQEKKLYCYRFGNSLPPNEGKPQAICIEENGKVWVGTNGDGVFLYNRSSDSFQQLLGDKGDDTLQGEHIYTMCDYGDEIVVGIHEGKLRKLHKLKNTLSDVAAPDVHYKIIRHVVRFGAELWVATEAGVYIINELEKTVVNLHEDPMSDFSLSDNMTERIYRDRENGIWIASYFGGVNYLPQRRSVFEQYVPLSRSNSINSKRIRELKEDELGNIWIGTEDGGLNLLDTKNGTFSYMKRADNSSQDYRKSLGLSVIGNNQVWVGFFKSGLDVINIQNKQLAHYSAGQLGLNEASITAILEDHSGKIWIGNAWGVFVAQRGMMKFERIDEIGSTYVYDLFEDSDGMIWIASMGMGVYMYNPQNESVKHFTHNGKDTGSLSSNAVSSIMEDSKGYIWFSTDRGGICRYDKKTGHFTSYSIKEGLPDDVAYKILEDRKQNLWFGTNKGLIKFDPTTGKVLRIYTKNDGLPGNQFNYKSALKTRSGKFYFGGLDGLIAFNPDNFRGNDYMPPVYITKLTSFNKEIDVETSNSPLTESIIHTKKLVLKHNLSNIGFDFSALSYVSPSANQYAYKMEGLDDDWTYTTHNQSASYAKLPPGKYLFRVKASNNDGIWNEDGAEIEIEVLPPWWQTSIAYIIYLVATLFLIFFAIRWFLKKKEKQNAEQRHLFEIEKEKELYNSKLDFFTNIAHEIRTPLSLINGPLESLSEMNINDAEVNKNLSIMGRNTEKLLNLVNQLLDFRKVDSNNLALVLSGQNISSLVKDVVMEFEPVASKNKKNLRLHLAENEVQASVDRSEFLKIMNNLLSNAVKYSEQNIDVYLSADAECFVISVQSDGELIPENQREKIFEPFYQLSKDKDSPSGSGIGLSLVRSLVELHNGQIYLETNAGINNFLLKFPLTQQNAVKALPDKDLICEEEAVQQKGNGLESVLLVEDNPEMLTFIADRLKGVFAIETASNGSEALAVLQEKNVDIIVSDVMMPDMDGYELSRRLKQNIEYSHIPIVLLTAKNDLNSKIQGLESGAEAYIEKPFSTNYLISQLTTLLNNRRRERESFIHKPFIPVQQIGINKADEKFMERIIDIINENITETDFTIDRIAEAVFMSRSSLNRKIKAITGLTPTDFIRLIRLRKAAELLQNGEYRIGEICYMVGFSSSSYFIRLFQKQFGMTPREFAKQQQERK
ncbi:hybrid sensor histidine kinase/response regulator transcription factor [Dysgonomonas sp. 520]|uniref:hybrid sensor histidine kinase/response regulator transcription factor n=1 Tax=Dysgonomonas sp. 520 TaxID=2302931 RepID=UPI0013D4F002|nr:hybrid sensor histidine kinase/response regulator transcription factor [Dysgonomonas sp. 520]NDW10792.1 hybrid sensor histidine kinase/response regulator [Dysgonomonas sp. 520]